MVHGIQGYGGGLLYDGQYIVNHTNIILVTINYRLGALGFLVYGSNLEIGGNYGLKVHTIHRFVLCIPVSTCVGSTFCSEVGTREHCLLWW